MAHRTGAGQVGLESHADQFVRTFSEDEAPADLEWPDPRTAVLNLDSRPWHRPQFPIAHLECVRRLADEASA